jgi:hypothetical protein
MGRIRIRCVRPEQQSGHPLCCIVPSWPDTVVTYIDDNGTEVELDNVMSVRFEIEAGAEPARVALSFMNVEMDVETPVDFTPGAGLALLNAAEQVLHDVDHKSRPPYDALESAVEAARGAS